MSLKDYPGYSEVWKKDYPEIRKEGRRASSQETTRMNQGKKMAAYPSEVSSRTVKDGWWTGEDILQRKLTRSTVTVCGCEAKERA
jgi:hypothetical protein